MNSVITTLLTISISGTVLALLLFALKPFTKNKVTKSFSYYIWLLVLLRLVLPFGFGLNISALVPVSENEAVEGAPLQGSSQVIASDNVQNYVAPTENTSSTNNDGISTVPKTEAVISPVTPTATKSDLFLFLQENLMTIWIAGMLISVCWYGLAYTAFKRRIVGSCLPPHSADTAVFDELSGGKKLRFACSSRISTPMLIGVLKPVVVVPQHNYVQYGMETELRNILCHELMHYRRHDTLYKWFAVLVNCVHWFNPVVYLVSREISHACELSCDEAVIGEMSPTQRQSYGNTLLTLAATKRLPVGVMATTLAEEKKQLKSRLLSIRDYRKKSASAIALMLALVMLLAGCAAIYPSIEQDSEDTDVVNTQSPSIEAATLTILPSTEQLLSEYSAVYEFDMSEDEYVHTLLLKTDTVIKNLRLFDIGIKDESDDLSLYENGILYSIEEFTPDKPLLISMSFPGSAPSKGLCYTDTDGATKYYYIAMSGDDGSIMLVQFDNSEPEISSMFENVFLMLVRGEIENNWESVKRIFDDNEYHYYDGEGVFVVDDPESVGSYIGGSLTNKNGYAQIAQLTYQYVDGYTALKVMVDLTGDTPRYYIKAETPGIDTTQVPTEMEMLEYLYNGDQSNVDTPENFLAMVFQSTLLEGYSAEPTETYSQVQLAAPSSLPENFELYDAVFVKQNPGTGEDMILRLWYSFEKQAILTIVQYDAGNMLYGEAFSFQDSNMMGSPISMHFQWATHCGSQALIESGKYISGYMLVNGAGMEDECREILQSMTITQ